MTRTSVMGRGLLFSRLDEQHAVDLVDLDELHLDALLACGGQVLADVVGTDRELAMAAVDQAGKLDARRAPVVEERVDGRADRAPRVEDVVDQDARLARDRELQLAVAQDRLRMQRSLSPAPDDHVVPVEGDVEGAERELDVRSLRDQPPESLRERHAARMDADEGRPVKVGIALDDLVRDPDERALDRLGVEQDLRGRQAGLRQGRAEVEGLGRAGACVILDSFPASRDRVKGA